jgi:hypothetical protein
MTVYMTNKIYFFFAYALLATTAVIAQKNVSNTTTRYVQPSVIIGGQVHVICPVNVYTGGDDDSGNNNTQVSSTIDSIAPYLRIAECTPQTLRIDWHVPANSNAANNVLEFRKNNNIVYTATYSAGTTTAAIPITLLSQGDALQITLQHGLQQYLLNCVFVTNLNTTYLVGGNAPMPMATVETVHPRRPRSAMRGATNSVIGQCLYVHDAENTTAAFYRTADVAMLSGVTNLTDSIFSAEIAGKTAYITYDQNFGTCYNADNGDNMRSVVNIVQVYPNPSEEAFHIQYTNTTTSTLKISVSDLQGREVYSYEKNGDTEGAHDIAIDNLPKGIYLYFLQKNNQMQRGTLVKQ